MTRPSFLLSLAAVLSLVGCGDKDTGGDTETTDQDSDGYAVDEDCDDLDPTVYPGATEYCNGKDDNCDGEVDVEAIDAPLYYADVDGDGYGDGNSTTKSCDPPAGYSADATDCDDRDDGINPGAIDVPTDDIDQDCDGVDRCGTATVHKGDLQFTGDEDKYYPLCDKYAEVIVEGTLSISNSEFEDLTDLDCLCGAGNLRIEYNHELTSLTGLEGIADLTGD
jgi:hypothetical protein